MQRVPVPSYSGAYENDFCRIGRLVAEAVEVALDLCNKYLYTVTNIKILDIVNQILPTAWVLNTGYWALYSSQNGHCLCICARFSIPCNHIRSYDHWIDLSQSVAERHYPVDTKLIFLPNQCSLNVKNYLCTTTAVDNQTYNISVKFDLHIRPKPGDSQLLAQDITVWFNGRYQLTMERYVAPPTYFMFHPNPRAMPTYGQILSEVLTKSAIEDTYVTSNASKFTFVHTVPSGVVPVYHTIIAFPICCATFPKPPPTRTVGTQTEDASYLQFPALPMPPGFAPHWAHPPPFNPYAAGTQEGAWGARRGARAAGGPVRRRRGRQPQASEPPKREASQETVVSNTQSFQPTEDDFDIINEVMFNNIMKKDG